MYGYANKWLDVNLTNRSFEIISFEDKTLLNFYGGAGMGAKILFDRVPPGIEWHNPANCIIICGGPMNGSGIAGSGAHCEVTKGSLTNGATSVQAMGALGAYLSSSGFDGIIVHGKSDKLVCLYIHDGTLEFMDVEDLSGKDTRTTELQIKQRLQLPGRKSSVYSIGLSGENLVRFACVAGDNGHVCAHNGIGAVWGSKNLKAVAVARGAKTVELYDPQLVKKLNKRLIEENKSSPLMTRGTSWLMGRYFDQGLVPYKNLTGSVIPKHYNKLFGEYYRENFKFKREPCFRCFSNHCNTVTVTEGKYKGFEGDEPEYELMAGMGTMIGNADPGAAMMLANQWDYIGCDGNEGSWLMAFVIECFERGLLTLKDTDGLELRWGNTGAVYELIWKIARREGIGNILAEGVKRSAEIFGGEALDIAVYQMKGHAPRGHDHRARWIEMFDTAVSNCGTIEDTYYPMPPEESFSPDGLAQALYKGKTRMFVDSLVMCMFTTNTMNSIEFPLLVEMVNAVTGWGVDYNDCFRQGLRTVNLLRVFNVKHGLGPELEYPSKRYGSAPADGPLKGKNIMDIWEETLDKYYLYMGWNRSNGLPYPETLKQLGLDEAISE